MPPVSAAEARALAAAAVNRPIAVASVRRFAADANPVDLRRDRPAWQVRTDDGIHIYIDVDSGEVLALRTRFWRAFDVAWGLHIMDLQRREDTHHPVLILFAVLALAGTVVGTVLLFRRRSGRS